MSNPYNTLKERTSILGPTIKFKGELSSEEDLVINGKIEGSITRTQKLTIGREGSVNANVEATLVVIEGTIEGDVRAEKSVSVTETALMTGNITAPSVMIQQGAKFNGSVDMSDGKAGKAPASGSGSRATNAS
ncbi:MAG TPA: polymer-forming cytoskeletal protein [Steroidobacteraceae bacterium]|nr:polymer-forming cytoskeletal protein [Steroidobacteraceae bacterium]